MASTCTRPRHTNSPPERARGELSRRLSSPIIRFHPPHCSRLLFSPHTGVSSGGAARRGRTHRPITRPPFLLVHAPLRYLLRMERFIDRFRSIGLCQFVDRLRLIDLEPLKPYAEKTWIAVMPSPRRQQHSKIGLPDFEGSCPVHSFSEMSTAWLRIGFGTNDITVDLERLLHLTAAKGYLITSGSSLMWLDDLATNYGIPLDGEIPAHLNGHPNYRLVDAHAEAYAINTKVYSYSATPMPFSNPTPEVVKKVIEYREHLCDLLNCGPVVLCFEIQDHYGEPRNEGEPYCRVEERKSWFSFADPPRVKHCVTAYGYKCPGGDVRSLHLLCQENMTGAPTAEPGYLVIHPDAVDTYHVTYINNVLLSNTPRDGYMKVKREEPC